MFHHWNTFYYQLVALHHLLVMLLRYINELLDHPKGKNDVHCLSHGITGKRCRCLGRFYTARSPFSTLRNLWKKVTKVFEKSVRSQNCVNMNAYMYESNCSTSKFGVKCRGRLKHKLVQHVYLLGGGGWIRLIVGFQPLMVISPTVSWIRWCMQVYACEFTSVGCAVQVMTAPKKRSTKSKVFAKVRAMRQWEVYLNIWLFLLVRHHKRTRHYGWWVLLVCISDKPCLFLHWRIACKELKYENKQVMIPVASVAKTI